jgi:cell division protein FtsB
MASGHSTSRLRRPGDATRAKARADATRAAERRTRKGDDTRFADLTRPIPEERRVARGGRQRLAAIVGFAVVGVLLLASLFVLPVKSWLRQGTSISEKQRQLRALQEANSQLANDINRLGTRQGIEEAARQEIGYVERGEIRLTLLPSPAAPTKLPTGWPFDPITAVIAVRTAGLTTPAPASTPTSTKGAGTTVAITPPAVSATSGG